MPDFCPATSARRPLASVTRIGDDAKSKSGPFDVGAVGLVRQPARRRVQRPSASSACDHRIFPDVEVERDERVAHVGVGGSL